MSQQNHIWSIDALRGVAVTLVVFYHSHLLVGNRMSYEDFNFNYLNEARFWSGLPFELGWVGVLLFFVLSGFSIHWSQEQRVQTTHGIWEFYVRRFFRIYPAYAFSVLFLFGHHVMRYRIFHETFREDVFSNVILIKHLTLIQPFVGFMWNTVYWSLIVELLLYLVYPLFIRWVWKRYPSNLIWLNAGLISLCQLFLLSRFRYLDGPFSNMLIYGFCFVSGMVLAEKHKQSVIYWLSRPWWLLGMFLLGTCMILHRTSLPYSILPFTIVCTGIVSVFLHIPTYHWWGKLLAFLGTISYSMYLYHNVLMKYAYWIWYKFFKPEIWLDLSFGLIFTFLVYIGFSYLSYKWIESPGIALGKWFLAKKR